MKNPILILALGAAIVALALTQLGGATLPTNEPNWRCKPNGHRFYSATKPAKCPSCYSGDIEPFSYPGAKKT